VDHLVIVQRREVITEQSGCKIAQLQIDGDKLAVDGALVRLGEQEVLLLQYAADLLDARRPQLAEAFAERGLRQARRGAVAFEGAVYRRVIEQAPELAQHLARRPRREAVRVGAGEQQQRLRQLLTGRQAELRQRDQLH